MINGRNLLLTFLIACVSASAQQITGNIRGTVSDPTSAVVQNATVTARHVETGLARTATTNRAGSFLLLELPVGHYQLEVTATGSQKYLQEGVSLDVNETATVPIHLVVGSEKEKVQVQADADLIQPTVTALGEVVHKREILDLPLDGRNFSQFGLLQPGVVPLTPGLEEAGGSLRQGQADAVNGQRPESNNFLIDGANNFNGVDGGFVLRPPIDAISEFRILTHNANAEFGNSLGSTTNIVTRSGSNAFHGAVWEFLRNNAFDATRYPATTVEPLKQNQFGGSFGGPIRKEKTFFFAYYEGFRNRQGEPAGSTVPSLKERTGDFSQPCDPNQQEQFDSAGMCSNPAHQLMFLVPTPTPLPFNRMPPFLLSSFSPNLLSLFPNPNSGTNVFTSTEIKRDDSNQGGLRLDHYLTASDTLNFRYIISDGNRFDPLSPAGASIPGFPIDEEQAVAKFCDSGDSHLLSGCGRGLAFLFPPQ
jgi:hypothetical protein